VVSWQVGKERHSVSRHALLAYGKFKKKPTILHWQRAQLTEAALILPTGR
jgi:hypothetical protein